MKAVIYARLSATPGDPDNYPQQVSDGRALADELSWEVVEPPIEEPPHSAYEDAALRREGFLRLRDMIGSDEVNAIIVRDADRLSRDIVAYAELLRFRKRVMMATTDRTVMPLEEWAEHVAAAARESRVKSRRGQASERRRVERGQAPRGGRRHWGYHSGTCCDDCQPHAVKEDEADVARDLARRWLAGETMTSLVTWLNERDIRTTNGNRWTNTGLKRMLTSRRLAAIRIHRGREVQGNWEPVLSRELHHQLVAANGRSKLQRRPEAYLLRELVRCGRCDGRVQGHRHANAARRYRCVGCTNGIAADPVDRLVWAAALGRTWHRDRASEERARDRLVEVERERAEAQGMRDELDDDYWQRRNIPRRTYDRQAAALDATLDSLASEARRLRQNLQEATNFWASLRNMVEHYETATWDERRAVLRGAIRRVVIEATGVESPDYPVDSDGEPIVIDGVHHNVKLTRVGVRWR